MVTLTNERGEICPRCKRIAIKLIDDGKGKKVCRRCKRELKKAENDIQRTQTLWESEYFYNNLALA